MKKVMHYVFNVFIDNIVKFIGMALLLVVGIQIFSRMFMKIPFSWSEELARFTFIWYCFLGSAVALKAKQHLGIDYFYMKLNLKSKYIVDIIIQLLTIGFGVFIAYYGWKLLGITGKRNSPVMRINMSYIFSCIPITGILFIMIAMDNMVDLLRKNEHSNSSKI